MKAGFSGSWKPGLAGPEANTAQHSRNSRTTTAAAGRPKRRVIARRAPLGVDGRACPVADGRWPGGEAAPPMARTTGPSLGTWGLRGPDAGRPSRAASAETAVHVVGSSRVDGIVEELSGRPGLHDVPGGVLGGEEERAEARYPLRLLHVVRDDHDRDLAGQLAD